MVVAGCVILRIDAQHQLQAGHKTFAATQFDLDPNLPSEDFINDVIPTPEIVNSPLQQLKKPTMVRSPSIPSNMEQIPHVQLRLTPHSQQHTTTITSPIAAPRAKAYRTISAPIARAPEMAKYPGTIPSQTQTLPSIVLSSENSNSSFQNAFLGSHVPLPTDIHAPSKQPQTQTSQPQIEVPLMQNHPKTSLSLSVPPASNPHVAPSIALGDTTLNSEIPVQRRISAASLWFNETLPSFDCSHDYQHVAMEFKRKFPVKTAKDVRDKRLAEVVEKQLTICDRKLKNDHWSHLMKYLPKVKLSPSEEENCRNGLVQEHIACINLMSYICQFIRHEYAFRLVPARVILQEARLAEDGAEKCLKVVRFIKKHDQPK